MHKQTIPSQILSNKVTSTVLKLSIYQMLKAGIEKDAREVMEIHPLIAFIFDLVPGSVRFQELVS